MSISITKSLVVFGLVLSLNCIASSNESDALEKANPLKPIAAAPLGLGVELSQLPNPPTPQTVRLGRWLFYDTKLSIDNTLSCASCHKPEHAFSEPTPHSTGVGGKEGNRKAPPVINLAWSPLGVMFWDGRAKSLEEQASGPMLNPIEMGHVNVETIIARLKNAKGYAKYFSQAFGDDAITIDRVARAIADYERTRQSGNSPWDRWRANFDPGDREIIVKMTIAQDVSNDYESPAPVAAPQKNPFKDGPIVSAKVKWGHVLFHGKAACNQCHIPPMFNDGKFHNLGVGWDATSKTFKDEGRFVVTKQPIDHGAFKTPTLRELGKRAPYMHDGSIKTLKEVVELYNRGGEKNPSLSPLIKPLNLSAEEIDAIVAMLEALNGEGYMDQAPVEFPN